MKIYDITYSHENTVLHTYIVAASFVEALEELDEIMPNIYYDVLGCEEYELPQLLRRHAL
jgi:hypothetical protein